MIMCVFYNFLRSQYCTGAISLMYVMKFWWDQNLCPLKPELLCGTMLYYCTLMKSHPLSHS